MLGRCVVPIVARRGLIVPLVLTRRGIDCDDGRNEEVVAVAIRVADVGVPRRAVADAEDDLVVHFVIDDRVPDRAAAAIGDPCAVIAPCVIGEFCEDRIGGCAVRLLVRVRHRVEAPVEVTCLSVISRQVATDAELSAAIPDEDVAFNDARGASDRVRLGLVDGDDAPFHFAGFSVEGLEAAIDHADKDLAIIDSDAAVHDVTAGFYANGAVDFRVMHPELFASDRVQRVDDRPG